MNEQAAKLTRWLLATGAVRNVAALLQQSFAPAVVAAATIDASTITAYPVNPASEPTGEHWQPVDNGWAHPLHAALLPLSSSADHHVLAGVTSRNEVLLLNLAAAGYIGIEGGEAIPVMRSWLIQILRSNPEAQIAVDDPALAISGVHRLSLIDQVPPTTATILFTTGHTNSRRGQTITVSSQAATASNIVLCNEAVAGIYLANRYWPMWRRMQITDERWAPIIDALHPNAAQPAPTRSDDTSPAATSTVDDSTPERPEHRSARQPLVAPTSPTQRPLTQTSSGGEGDEVQSLTTNAPRTDDSPLWLTAGGDAVAQDQPASGSATEKAATTSGDGTSPTCGAGRAGPAEEGGAPAGFNQPDDTFAIEDGLEVQRTPSRPGGHELKHAGHTDESVPGADNAFHAVPAQQAMPPQTAQTSGDDMSRGFEVTEDPPEPASGPTPAGGSAAQRQRGPHDGSTPSQPALSSANDTSPESVAYQPAAAETVPTSGDATSRVIGESEVPAAPALDPATVAATGSGFHAAGAGRHQLGPSDSPAPSQPAATSADDTSRTAAVVEQISRETDRTSTDGTSPGVGENRDPAAGSGSPSPSGVADRGRRSGDEPGPPGEAAPRYDGIASDSEPSHHKPDETARTSDDDKSPVVSPHPVAAPAATPNLTSFTPIRLPDPPATTKAPQATPEDQEPLLPGRPPTAAQLGLYILGETYALGVDDSGAPTKIPAVTRQGVRKPIKALMVLATSSGLTTPEWDTEMNSTPANRRQMRSNIRKLMGGNDPIREDRRGLLVVDTFCDWKEFQRLTGSIPAEATTEALTAAVSLIRGAPFADIPDGEYGWRSAELLKDHLLDQCSDAALELARRHHDAGATTLAYQTARLGITVYPQREDLWAMAAATATDSDRPGLIWDLKQVIPTPKTAELRQFLSAARSH